MTTRSTGILTVVAVIWMVGVNPATNTPASALPPFLNEWSDQYPDSLTDDNLNTGGGSFCQVCHAEPSGGASWNGYGWSIREVYLDNGGDLLAAIIGVEGLSPDNDPTLCSSIINDQRRHAAGLDGRAEEHVLFSRRLDIGKPVAAGRRAGRL